MEKQSNNERERCAMKRHKDVDLTNPEWWMDGFIRNFRRVCYDGIANFIWFCYIFCVSVFFNGLEAYNGLSSLR